MQLRSIRELKNLKGKTVLYRVAYDIESVEENGNRVVKDTTRIAATLPTLRELIAAQCKIVLLTWVKRPGGKVVEALRTAPHAEVLAKLLGKPVAVAIDCVGSDVDRAVAALQPGELLMLENVRFHSEEEHGVDVAFAKALAKGKDLVVFDAFAQAHRRHASTVGILEQLPSVAGLLMEKEIVAFEKILENPDRPVVALLGGAKVSDKVSTIRFLLSRVDLLLIGGALTNTFLKGLGRPTERSLTDAAVVDDEQKTMDIAAVAAYIFRTAPARTMSGLSDDITKKLILPSDLLAASDTTENAQAKIIDPWHDTLPARWQYLDLGPQTIARYAEILKKAKTIFWNGPMGLFEVDRFSKGTRAMADAIIGSKAFSIVGGGDTEAIVQRYGLENKFSLVSTGGGVSLELLAGKELPVVHYLKK